MTDENSTYGDLGMYFSGGHRWTARKVSDGERTKAALQATEGKRLTYYPLKATGGTQALVKS